MMGKTHLAAGIAASLVLTQPCTALACVVAVAGGALGGVLADIDTVRSDYKRDALAGQILAILIASAVLSIDYFLQLGIFQFIFEHKPPSIIGAILFLLLCVKGFFSNHRTFTHSLLAAVLFSAAIGLIYPNMFAAFAAAYLSHLALDLLNKRPVPIFYPFGKGFCLKLFYASKLANSIFMILGFAVCVVMLMDCFEKIF